MSDTLREVLVSDTLREVLVSDTLRTCLQLRCGQDVKRDVESLRNRNLRNNHHLSEYGTENFAFAGARAARPPRDDRGRRAQTRNAMGRVALPRDRRA